MISVLSILALSDAHAVNKTICAKIDTAFTDSWNPTMPQDGAGDFWRQNGQRPARGV